MSSNLDSQAREVLKSAGLYRTKGRVAVLKALLKAEKPSTASSSDHLWADHTEDPPT